MKQIIILFLISFFCFFSGQTFAEIKFNDIVQIGILLDVEKLNVASDKQYVIFNNGKKVVLSAGNVDIKLVGNRIVIGKNKKDLTLPVRIKAQSYLVVNKTVYRGDILLKLSQKGKINVINELNIDDYLKGVLPKEAGPSWPIEALKAQAVISRSFTIKNLKKHSNKHFNLCSTVCCQVYGGASAESKLCNQAVMETKGIVLTYKNEIAQTFFHSSCGGHTEDPKYVWGWKTETPQYLKGIKDIYCKNNPQQNWKCTIDEKTIRTKLTNAGYKIGEISKISYSGSTTGKARKEIVIKHKNGTLKLNSYKFRITVDPWLIKSTMISDITKQKDKFIFKGNGWGHKVGLCQWGAKNLAEQGYKYDKILTFYYPGTKTDNIKNGKK